MQLESGAFVCVVWTKLHYALFTATFCKPAARRCSAQDPVKANDVGKWMFTAGKTKKANSLKRMVSLATFREWWSKVPGTQTTLSHAELKVCSKAMRSMR